VRVESVKFVLTILKIVEWNGNIEQKCNVDERVIYIYIWSATNV
jgi:hypothetical protein